MLGLLTTTQVSGSYGCSHMFMRRLRPSLAFMAISVLCLSCGSPGPEDQVLPPTAQVTVNAPSQLVTIDVKNAPLAAVLAAIGQQAQIAISVSGDLTSERLSMSFQDVPLEEALRRVLAGQSYAFVYTQDKGREVIAGVRLFAKHEPVPAVGSAPSGMRGMVQLPGSQGLPTPLSATRSWGHGGSTMNKEARVPIGEDVPLDELQRSFSQTKDPVLRSAMLDAMADRGEEEEKPVAPVLSTALSDSDEDVRSEEHTSELQSR